MVHLASVIPDSEALKPVIESLEQTDFFPENDASDEFSASVYGSKFAAKDLPRHEMPENEMPKDIAYRMIK